MSVFESSVDYSKVVEHDELERGSDINRLELAYRRENDFDTTLMTVSMSKNDNIDVNTRSSLFGTCGRFGRIPLAVYLLLVSACLIITAVTLQKVLIKKKAKQSVLYFLLIVRSVGIFSFIGQLSHFIAWKFSFFNDRVFCCERSKFKARQDITQCLKRFLTCTIFDEVAVRNYIRRINITRDETRLRDILEYIESSELNDIVADHLSQVYDSAEGPLLDTIGIDKSQLHAHCNYILQQAVCKVLRKFLKEVSTEDWRRPEMIRSHVVEVVNLQLQSLNWKDITKFMKSISRRQSNRQALIVFTSMAFAGCIVEVLYLFLPL